MNVSTTINWVAVEWPTAGIPSDKYAVFVNDAASPVTTTSGGATSASVTYDDTTGVTFLVRPTDTTTYGPVQSVVITTEPLGHRAWLRGYVRKAVGDRTDTGAVATPKLTDDELNEYVCDAIRVYGLSFPKEKETTITLVTGQRTYALPADFQRVLAARYSTADGHLQLWLKEEPYKGGETTATTYVGYPKLGLLARPSSGRLYGGHFDIYEGELSIDFDPRGDGDTLQLRYAGVRDYPASELDPLDVPAADWEMLSLYVQALAWRQIEAKDVALSRWRGRDDGTRRDDMPTEKMSTRMFNAYQTHVNQRLSLRPRTLRLVRRT